MIPTHTLTAAEIALDHTSLTFGKYRGQTPDDISESDPSYICWLYETVKDKPTCSITLYRTCKDEKFSRTKDVEPYEPLDPINDLEF